MGGKGSGAKKGSKGGPGRNRKGLVAFTARINPRLAAKLKVEAKARGIGLGELLTMAFDNFPFSIDRKEKLPTAPHETGLSEKDNRISFRGPEKKSPFDLVKFAELVTEIAGRDETRKFAGKKSFICSIWEQFSLEQPWGLTEKAFKGHLVVANREDLLALSRADLVGAMDPEDVARSEVAYMVSTWHFVNLRMANEYGV